MRCLDVLRPHSFPDVVLDVDPAVEGIDQQLARPAPWGAVDPRCGRKRAVGQDHVEDEAFGHRQAHAPLAVDDLEPDAGEVLDERRAARSALVDTGLETGPAHRYRGLDHFRDAGDFLGCQHLLVADAAALVQSFDGPLQPIGSDGIKRGVGLGCPRFVAVALGKLCRAKLGFRLSQLAPHLRRDQRALGFNCPDLFFDRAEVGACIAKPLLGPCDGPQALGLGHSGCPSAEEVALR